MKKLMILIGAVATSIGVYAADYAMTVEGKDGGYNSFKAAIEAAKDGALITLHQDVSTDFADNEDWVYAANQKMNINLNGKVLTHDVHNNYFATITADGASLSLSGGGELKVGYGGDHYPYGIKVNGNAGLYLTNVTVSCYDGPAVSSNQGSPCVDLVHSTLHSDKVHNQIATVQSTASSLTVNIDKDSIVSSAGKVFDVYNSTSVNIYGQIDSKATGYALIDANNSALSTLHFFAGSKGTGGSQVIKNGGKVIVDESAELTSLNGAAIQIGKGGKLTIADGAIVSGKTGAVSITDENVTADIQGGTFTATSGKAVSVSGNSTLTGFISGGEFKGTQAMPADYIASKTGYESRWVDAATAGYVTPGYVRVFNVTYTTAHGEAPAVKTVYPTLVDDDQYEYTLTAADLPTLPDADGYVFKGWYIDSQKVEVGTVISADVSLTASWELATVAFTVSWDGTAKISKAYAKVGAAEKSEIQNGEAIQVIPGTVVTLSADFTESWIKCPELTDYTVDAATAVTLTTAKIDPSSDITPDTKAADVGITDGAFKEMTGTELGRVVGWAEAKGFSPSDLNNVAFDDDGDATTPAAEAYLLNCSAAELEQAKANFKITAITQNDDGSWTVEVNGKQFNGVVEKVPVEDITVTNGELYRAALRFKPSND